MKKIAASCLALVSVLTLAAAAGAQNPQQYGAFRVHNNTDKPITYKVRWFVNGVDQGWQTFTVQPQATNPHSAAWNPGQSFPYADWTFYDYTKGRWSPVAHPAGAIGTDPNGGFSNNFVLLPSGDLIVGSSD